MYGLSEMNSLKEHIILFLKKIFLIILILGTTLSILVSCNYNEENDTNENHNSSVMDSSDEKDNNINVTGTKSLKDLLNNNFQMIQEQSFGWVDFENFDTVKFISGINKEADNL